MTVRRVRLARPFGSSGDQGPFRTTILSLGAIVIAAGLLAVAASDVAASVLVLAVGFLTILLAANRMPFVLVPTFIGLGVRLAAFTYHRLVGPLPQASDAVVFERRAERLAELPVSEHFQRFGTGSDSVAWLAAWLLRAFGPETVVPQLVMVVLGALLVISTAQLARALGASERMVVIAAWAMALFPQPIVHSALLLREIPFSLLITVAAVFLVRWERTADPRYAVLGALGMLAASVFHVAAIVLFLAALAYVLIRSTRTSNIVRALASVVSVLALAGFVVSTDYIGEELGGSLEEVEMVYFAREARAPVGGAAYPEELRIRNVGEIWKAPARVALFLFAPLPWMVTTARQALGVLDSVLYAAAAMFVAHGARSWRRGSRFGGARLLLVLLFVGVLVFSLNVANFGTAIRHRAKFAPYVVAVAVLAVGAPRADTGTRPGSGTGPQHSSA